MMKGNAVRFGLTENLANYTPDVGLSLSFAHLYE
jgi:hypothetical protein